MNDVSTVALEQPASMAAESDTPMPAALAIGGITAAVALTGFLAILATGHLDEDAYILFTYSRNLAAGHGIVWDWAHGHVEGATDFLWMVLLAGLDRLGMDVGAAAALLNAAGLATSYFAISRIARLRGVAAHCLLAAALLVSHITAGSLGGFSADFYCGVFALCCYLGVRREYGALALALLALGLVRPDGVILAAGVLIAVSVFDPGGVWRKVAYFAAAGTVGLGYFLWRWWYFGLTLPLPLIVKGHALSLLLGLHWNVLPLIPLGGVLALVLWQRRAIADRALIVAAGPVLLFVALCFANQLQDLSFRFQAPMTLAVLTLGVCAGRDRTGWLLLALIPSLAFGARAIDREVRYLVQPDYVNYFPQMINPQLGKDGRVAVTEAGRFGFRLDAEKLDIVGLNSKAIAVHGDRVQALAAFKPDLVFLHQVWTLDTSGLDAHRNWIALTRAQYLSLPVLDSRASLYRTDPTHLGAMAARQFIATASAPYYIYAVKYRGEFSHFYFLRADGRLTKTAFEAALARSFQPASVRPHCAYSGGFPCPWLAASAAR
ncbi:MAG: hypothetical protein ACYDAE_07335 [Steroidobacteraceae bacterium]